MKHPALQRVSCAACVSELRARAALVLSCSPHPVIPPKRRTAIAPASLPSVADPGATAPSLHLFFKRQPHCICWITTEEPGLGAHSATAKRCRVWELDGQHARARARARTAQLPAQGRRLLLAQAPLHQKLTLLRSVSADKSSSTSGAALHAAKCVPPLCAHTGDLLHALLPWATP